MEFDKNFTRFSPEIQAQVDKQMELFNLAYQDLQRSAGHWVSGSCVGEFCSVCGSHAKHKLGEEIFNDDPNPVRHNLTAYVCCFHFRMIMGPAVPCRKEQG